MAILDGDIQLLRSEVLDDVAEGGGMATGAVVVDGASNNLFSDISELDRTYGRISLRKAFPAVVTDNVDSYYSAHVIVAKPPADEKVSVSLFTTKSWSDLRSGAKDKLESYLAMGAEGRWMLYGNHLAGQRTLQLHCPHALASPAVDEVLALVKRDDETVYQYTRVSRLISRQEGVEFEDTRGVFYRDVITLELSAPLSYAFKAASMERFTADWFSPPTRIHVTVAADATSYFGVSKLRAAVGMGALTIKASSIYTQLVPSALTESPITDARCASDRSVIVPIDGGAALTFSTVISGGAGVSVTRYFGSAVARGSVSLSGAVPEITDDSNGNLILGASVCGSVDYAAGMATLVLPSFISGSVTFSAAPAVSISAAGHTDSIAVSTINRAYSYVKTLFPVPAPGTVELAYMAQGKWYSLYDDGAGGVSGNEGSGKGSIDYATGALVVTLGALPDADTELLFGWGSEAHYASHTGSQVFTLPTVKLAIDGGALEPGSVSITYLAATVSKVVTDNGAGILAGDGTGYIDYASGNIVMRPTVLPDSNSDLQVVYQQGGKTTENFTAAGALTNFTLAHPAKPGTLSLEFTDSVGARYLVTDNGSGVLVYRSAKFSGLISISDYAGQTLENDALSLRDSSGIGGSVNYTTGAVQLAMIATVAVTSRAGTGGSVWAVTDKTTVAAGNIEANYRVATNAAGAAETVSVPMPSISIDLLPSVSNTLVPGGVRFTLAGDTFVDRNGLLIKNPSATTNGGVTAGSINYTTGVVSLTDYAGGGSPSLVASCLTRRGTWSDWKLRFRTAGAPLQSASLYVRASRADTGATVSGTGTSGGDISGASIDGTVDYTTGIVSVRFGTWVAVSSLTADDLASDWYSAGDVVAGQILRPILVLPDTARYNGVVTSSLPLSSEILGLDPVRLPVDGRVPIFRKGDVVVVHHTDTYGPATVSNGQTVDLGVERLARIRVIDSAGATINTGYSRDLDAGTVSFTAVAGYAQPITIEHRIEDMAVLSDVQINGDMVLLRQLSHDYPIGAYVSSALVIGDMHARVPVMFDQATWSGWSDTQSGSAATGTYNKTQFPIAVTNRGSIEERWEVIFTNTGTVNVIGETVGQIVTGHPITTVLAPINPAQDVPYFTIDPAGWGSGWAAGNVLRFNTKGANYPVWIARTILQGAASVDTDQFTIGIRGDINA